MRIEDINKSKRMGVKITKKSKGGKKVVKMTAKQDKAFDKKKGWKEGSKGDIKQDKKYGIKDNKK